MGKGLPIGALHGQHRPRLHGSFDRLLSMQEAGRGVQRALRATAMAAGTAAGAQGHPAQAAALVAWRACPRVPSWAALLLGLGRCWSWPLVCDYAPTLLQDMTFSRSACIQQGCNGSGNLTHLLASAKCLLGFINAWLKQGLLCKACCSNSTCG